MTTSINDIILETICYIRKNIINIREAELSPEYYYKSLPLCVIDAVYTIGVRYVCAQNAVSSWCRSQDPPWSKFGRGTANSKSIRDLLVAVKGYEGDNLADRFFGGNKQRTSTRSGILKADAVVSFSEALCAAGVQVFDDLHDPAKIEKAKNSILTIPGQKSGISFDYFLRG